MRLAHSASLFALLLAGAASAAFADANVSSVTPVDGGCVSGPSGISTELWDVEPGKTYVITLTGVTECADGGTAATLNVRVNGTGQDEIQNTDLIATNIGPGMYQFTFTVPADASCTMPIYYCTTPGQANTGILVKSSSNPGFGTHLRASTFGPGCTNPVEIQGPNCQIVPSRPTSWGLVKRFYR
jgi:hypothetical protein